MARFEEHCQDCIEELGEPFEEVNLWLDGLFCILGPSHRDVRHNVLGVEKVREKWGDRAARAAEIHIIKDCRGGIPQIDEVFRIRIAFKPKVLEYFEKEYGKDALGDTI